MEFDRPLRIAVVGFDFEHLGKDLVDQRIVIEAVSIGKLL